MRKQVKKVIAVLFLFAGLALNPLKAQQVTFPFLISNNLLCSIDCSYTIYDPACVFVCSGTTGNIISSGSFPIPSCFATDYMVDVTVISINGTTITSSPNSPQNAPVASNCVTQNFTDGGNCSTSCDSGGLGVWTIIWTTTGCSVQ